MAPDQNGNASPNTIIQFDDESGTDADLPYVGSRNSNAQLIIMLLQSFVVFQQSWHILAVGRSRLLDDFMDHYPLHDVADGADGADARDGRRKREAGDVPHIYRARPKGIREEIRAMDCSATTVDISRLWQMIVSWIIIKSNSLIICLQLLHHYSIHLGMSNHRALDPSKVPVAVCPTSYSFSNNKTDYMNPYITTFSHVLGVFSSLGVIGFAYGAHNVVLEIQATLPSTRQKPSKIRMWRGVVVAYSIILIFYFPVALAGYWAFGNSLAHIGDSIGNLHFTSIGWAKSVGSQQQILWLQYL
ncbi:unnamed protein product [Calypogeia fissa]